MAVNELQNFRKKYPDYNDVDDATLAGMLAKKYPDAYGDLPAKVKAPAPSQPYNVNQAFQEEQMSGPQKFFVGMGAGFYDVGKGVQQFGADIGNRMGLVDDSTLQRITQEGQAARDDFAPLRESSYSAKAGEFMGKVLPFVTVPGGVQGRALTRAATAGLAGAGVGAAQFVPEGESRGMNALEGALLGGGTSLGMSAIGKGVNAVTGKTAPDPYGVPLTLGEQTGSPFAQRMESMLERAPSVLGIGAFRKKQNDAAQDAASNFLAKYVADPVSGDIAQGNREFVKGLYDEAKEIVSGVTEKIDPAKTKATASALLKRYPDIFKKLQDKDLEAIITDIVSGTKTRTETIGVGEAAVIGKHGKHGAPQKVLLDASGNPIKKTVKPELTFDEAWMLRKGLGEKLGQAKKLLARGEVDQTAYSQLKQMFRAVSDDLDNWADTIGKPEISEKFKAANGAYKNYVVKYDIIRRAYDKAAGEVGAGEMFSPKKFSTALKNIAYKDKELKTFTPQEIQEMTGIANVMQVVKRAGQYAENPPTGNRWGAVATTGGIGSAAYVAGGAAGTVKAAAAGASVALVSKFLTTTKAGKRLAMAASKVEPGSPRMRSIMNEIYNQLPKIAASAGTNASTQYGMSDLEAATLTTGE